jgi:hypothetical protein
MYYFLVNNVNTKREAGSLQSLFIQHTSAFLRYIYVFSIIFNTTPQSRSHTALHGSDH